MFYEIAAFVVHLYPYLSSLFIILCRRLNHGTFCYLGIFFYEEKVV